MKSKSHIAQTLIVTAAAAAFASGSALAQLGAIQAPEVRDNSGRPLLALYFDTTTLSSADRDRAVLAVTKFVQTQLKPDDSVAVMTSTAEGIQVVQDFTNDSSRLLNALKSISRLQAGGIASELPSSQAATLENDRRLAHLQAVAQMLGVLPDRKSLVYFAVGMARTSTDNQAQLRATVDAAIRAKVAFYPIDAQGLAVQ